MLKHTRMILMAAAGAWMVGCSILPIERTQNSPPEPENQAPIMVDQAMQLRDWQASTALYGNGNVVAGPTGFPYQPKVGMVECVYPFVESPLFVVQAAVSPITLIITPPFIPILYSGVSVGPTYTAIPAVPGGYETVPAAPATAPQP